MAKFKVNETIGFTEGQFKTGVIKSIKRVYDKDNKHTHITYHVKEPNSNETIVLQKKDLAKLTNSNKQERTPKISYQYVKLLNGSDLIVLGYLHKEVKEILVKKNGQYHVKREKYNTLKIGYALCHKDDEFILDFGIKLAKHKAKKSPLSVFETQYKMSLDEETVNSILMSKAKYIINNLHKFIKD